MMERMWPGAVADHCPDEPPTGTERKLGLTIAVRTYTAGGLAGIRALLAEEGTHRERCEAASTPEAWRRRAQASEQSEERGPTRRPSAIRVRDSDGFRGHRDSRWSHARSNTRQAPWRILGPRSRRAYHVKRTKPA